MKSQEYSNYEEAMNAFRLEVIKQISEALDKLILGDPEQNKIIEEAKQFIEISKN